MSVSYKHYAMLGIDITDYREKICQRELDLGAYDGLPKWSLNYSRTVVGYNDFSGSDMDKTFFGMILDRAEEHGEDFSTSWKLQELGIKASAIRFKWEEFLAEVFPKDEVTDREVEIRFMSVYS